MSENTVEDYGWEDQAPPESTGYIAPKIIQILKSLGGKRIADLGSGNGGLCGNLASIGYDCVGIEYDRTGIAIARKTYPHLNFYHLGVQDDPAKLLESEQKFDVVVSTEVVEHLFSPHLLPLFAKGLLVDDGWLVITTPYHGYVKNLALSVFNKWDKHHTALWHGGHIKFWSRKSLSQLLRNNGFDVLAFHGVGRYPLLWKSMVLIAKKK